MVSILFFNVWFSCSLLNCIPFRIQQRLLMWLRKSNDLRVSRSFLCVRTAWSPSMRLGILRHISVRTRVSDRLDVTSADRNSSQRDICRPMRTRIQEPSLLLADGRTVIKHIQGLVASKFTRENTLGRDPLFVTCQAVDDGFQRREIWLHTKGLIMHANGADRWMLSFVQDDLGILK